MKYIFLILLVGLLFDLAGCGPSEHASIAPGVNNSSVQKYKLSGYEKVTEFETTYGVRCVGYSKGLNSAALSCDWVGRQ